MELVMVRAAREAALEARYREQMELAMARAAREAALEARYREQMERARQPSRRAIVSRWSCGWA
jgi:hypothetical protein